MSKRDIIKEIKRDLDAETDYISFKYITVKEIYDLLKEQEAVEPIPFFTETGAESPNYVICGHCKSIKAMMEKHIKQKYCHECGRAVKWNA